MNTAIFAHPRSELPAKTLMPGKPELFGKLSERGVNAVVTFGGEDAFLDDVAEAHELTGESSSRKMGFIALDEVGLIVNRLDRGVKEDQMPKVWINKNVPRLNENAYRSLTSKKHRVQSEILSPLGIGMPTLLVESLDDADRFIAEHPSASYIVKPNSGTFSKGVIKLDYTNVVDHFKDESLLGKMIIQPAFDFTEPFPSALKPYDKLSEEDFNQLATSRVTKELRMYGFKSPQNTRIFPVGRALHNGSDTWFFVDPESVPTSVYETTRSTLEESARQTGSRAVYAALDIAYGTNSTAEAPDFHVVELNGRMPYLLGYEKHTGIADRLRDLLADQIAETVLKP